MLLKPVLQHLLRHGQRIGRTFAAVVNEDDHGNLRIFGRSISREPGMRWLVAGIAIPIFLRHIIAILSRAGLGRNIHTGDADSLSRAIFHRDRAFDAFLYNLKILQRHRYFLEDFRDGGTDHIAVSRRDFADDMRFHQHAIIRQSRHHIDHLQRCRRKEALPDRHIVGITQGPVFTASLALPDRVRHPAGRLANQIDARSRTIAEQLGILLQLVDPQPIEFRLAFDMVSTPTS